MIGKDFDVAKNMKLTEELQCRMLAAVSSFFTAMQENKSKAEKAEILAEMEVITFLLGARLGISKEALDQKAAARLKLALLKEERTEWKSTLLELYYDLEQSGR